MNGFNEVKDYWNERAKNAKLNPNATTDDVYLRELEINTFIREIKKINPLNVLDLGCGDGFTTLGVANKINNTKFLGVDYSDNMIKNANDRLAENPIEVKNRVSFTTGDATKLLEQFEPNSFDVIISSRCLINLPSTEQQYKTIEDISKLLKNNGTYISVENFEDGNKDFNDLRIKMGLDPIPVRWHNLFFNPEMYLEKTKQFFNTVELENFSSSYYYATRIIYSKFCQLKNEKPDYLHEIHQLAIDLPSMGNYSPIKLAIHKK